MKGLRRQLEADNVPTPDADPAGPPSKEKARKGLHFVGGYFSSEFARAIKMLVVQEDGTIQGFVRQALEDAARKRGADVSNLP